MYVYGYSCPRGVAGGSVSAFSCCDARSSLRQRGGITSVVIIAAKTTASLLQTALNVVQGVLNG